VVKLYASFNQQLVTEIKLSHQAIMMKIEDHDKDSEQRYERLGITRDLVKAAQERKR
jgi:hypothetical protein